MVEGSPVADTDVKPEARHDASDASKPAPGDALVQDLRSLRRLASQLHRRAATIDSHMLRAIMGKREALLDSIRSCLAPGADPSRPPDPSSFAEELALSAQEKEVIAETVHEIAVLDREAERLLRGRAEALAAEIQKLKAGRKSRESYRKWT